MNSRKLAALRNLAERPGTFAEGEVARKMLAREQAKLSPLDPILDGLFPGFGFDAATFEALWQKVHADLQGAIFKAQINAEKLRRFPKGTRAYYNAWGYPLNCPCVVVGYSREWDALRVQFDHARSVRSVPAYGTVYSVGGTSVSGWHLSMEPLSAEEARPLRGGMEILE